MGELFLRFVKSKRDDKIIAYTYLGKVCFIAPESQNNPKENSIWRCQVTIERERAITVIPLEEYIPLQNIP